MSEEIKEIAESFKAFLGEKAKVEDDKATLTLGNYREFLGKQGITKDMVDKIVNVEAGVGQGIVAFNTDKVFEKATNLMKEGKEEEAANTTFETKITIPQGVREVTTRACRKGRNPNSGETVYSFMRHKDIISTNDKFDKEEMSKTEESMRKLLGL